MVGIEEIVDDSASPTPSQERLLDADEIEKVASTLKRPTARMQLESLAKKLRRESIALKVVESHSSNGSPAEAPKASTPAAASPTPVMAPPTAAATAAVAKSVSRPPPPSNTGSSSVMYTTIDRFSFDAGGSSDKFVTLYVALPGVGEISKDQMTCDFEKAGFDLIVRDLRGQSYRLKKDNLEHDIVVDKCKFVVKADKVLVKLAKVKGEYGTFDYWSKLTDPKRKDKDRKKSKSDPASSITDLMKDMYDSGDDKMRKMIGETMMKQHRGELGKGADMDMGLGDSGGVDDV